MSAYIASQCVVAGLATAAMIGISTQAVAQSEPLRVVIQPGQSVQEAIVDAEVKSHAAKLRADWAAAKAAGQVGPAAYANPKITSVKILTPTVDVTVPPRSPKIEVTFQTDTPGIAYIYYSFRSTTGGQSLNNSWTYIGKPGLKSGVIDLQGVQVYSWMTDYAITGKWSLSYIDICDLAGDCSYYDYSSFPVAFAVANKPGQVDSAPPKVLSGKILTTSVSASSTNPAFIAQLSVSDNLSGVASTNVLIQPPGASWYYYGQGQTAAPLLSGQTNEITSLGSNPKVGSWTIAGFGACDVAGNCFTDTTAADVKKLFGTTTFTVTK